MMKCRPRIQKTYRQKKSQFIQNVSLEDFFKTVQYWIPTGQMTCFSLLFREEFRSVL